MKPALALNPGTPVDDELLKLLSDKPFDMVLVMTVGCKKISLP
jgi:pentose-5-phosphate-3-epimerase